MAREVIKVAIVGMLDRRMVPAVFIRVMNTTAVGVLAVRILATVFPPLAPLLSIGAHNSTGSNDELTGWQGGGGEPVRLQPLPGSHNTATLTKEEER